MINLLAPQYSVEKRLLWAVAASIAFHALLLAASPGRLHLGFGAQNPLFGESPRGKLLVRLTAPPTTENEPIADTPGPVVLTISETTTPDADTAQSVPQSPQVSSVPDDTSAVEVKRGEPVISAAAPVINDNTRLGLPLLPPQRYYIAKELDVRPQVKVSPVFKYPEAALMNRTNGKVIVDLFIDENGQVEDVAVVRAEPAGLFEQSAIAGWRTAQFTSGMKTNAKVKSRLSLEISFDMAQINAAQNSRSQY